MAEAKKVAISVQRSTLGLGVDAFLWVTVAPTIALASLSLAFSFSYRSSSRSCSRSRSLSSCSLRNLERPCSLVGLWRCSRLRPRTSFLELADLPFFDILHPCFLLPDMSVPSSFRLLISSFSGLPSCGNSFSAFLRAFPQLLSAKPPPLFFLSRTKSFSDRATLELDPQRFPSISCSAVHRERHQPEAASGGCDFLRDGFLPSHTCRVSEIV